MQELNTELIGYRLQIRRKEMQLTQKQLADKIGLHTTTISRYERGEIKDCKMPVLESIAKALRVNPVWLMGYDVPMVLENSKLLLELEAGETAESIKYLIENLNEAELNAWVSYGRFIMAQR